MAAPDPGTLTIASGTTQYIQTSNTGDNLATMAPEAVRKLWKRGIDEGEMNSDHWQGHEGTSMDSIIYAETDTSKGTGQTITYTTAAGFSHVGKFGEQLFLNPEDFEEHVLNSYSVTVDTIRNAVSSTIRMEEVMGLRDMIRTRENVKLGDWMGARKSELLDMTLLLRADDENVSFANNRTWSTLTSADTLDFNFIIQSQAGMKRRTKPAQMLDVNGQKVYSYMVMTPTDALTAMKYELLNGDLLKYADMGKGNATRYLSGGFPSIMGNKIQERHVIDEARKGAIGSTQNPKAYMGRRLTDGVVHSDDGGPAAANATEVWGNYNAKWSVDLQSHPYRWFSGYTYTLMYNQSYSTGAGAGSANTPREAPKYVRIINLTGADKGKWGFYRYTTNDGNKLTCDAYLRSSSGGQQNRGVVTLGGLTWDAAKNTVTHPAGSLVIPCTENGVPYGYTFFLGAGSLIRGYGRYRNHLAEEDFNGGFVKRKFIHSDFGQAPRFDAAGRQLGYMVGIHAISYADVDPLG